MSEGIRGVSLLHGSMFEHGNNTALMGINADYTGDLSWRERFPHGSIIPFVHPVSPTQLCNGTQCCVGRLRNTHSLVVMWTHHRNRLWVEVRLYAYSWAYERIP